ncbi:MAG: holdfast anchor protein HfaD [Hyphomonadaceae bacterium]
MRAAFLASAALIMAPLAHAQTRVNDQYQLRGTTAVTDVQVGQAHDVGATAVASGNVVTAVSENTDATMANTQHMDGDTNATASATVWSASGAVVTTSAAIGNGGTVTSANGDLDLTSSQLAHGDANATTTVVGGDARDAASSASASGNVGAVSIENAQARIVADQDSTGDTIAVVEADHCCVAYQATAGAIASANNMTVGGDTATVLTDTRQSATGERVAARTDLYAGYAGDASGNATANANTLTIDNQWGYVNARVSQTATADVSADSFVTLGGDFVGFGSAGAYGVGNQATVSNVGSDTVLDVAQDNAGDVSSNAALAGEGGGMALASSASYGNTFSASLCAYCDTNVPSLNASAAQTNSGDVYATARVHTPNAQTVGATSTAIGNAATFQTTGPGG